MAAARPKTGCLLDNTMRPVAATLGALPRAARFAPRLGMRGSPSSVVSKKKKKKRASVWGRAIRPIENKFVCETNGIFCFVFKVLTLSFVT